MKNTRAPQIVDKMQRIRARQIIPFVPRYCSPVNRVSRILEFCEVFWKKFAQRLREGRVMICKHCACTEKFNRQIVGVAQNFNNPPYNLLIDNLFSSENLLPSFCNLIIEINLLRFSSHPIFRVIKSADFFFDANFNRKNRDLGRSTWRRSNIQSETSFEFVSINP